jgi:DNA-binding CsgD family transcriptional regulator
MALLIDHLAIGAADAGPGLIVLSEAGNVETMNPSAQAWLADLVAPGFRVPEGWLPAPVHEVAMRARAIARTISDGSKPEHLQAHLRVQTHSGQWLMLHGSHMVGKSVGTGQTAVILERAHSSQIAQLLMLAYGLTPREREVLQQVLKGLATKEMAVMLHVSANTVQDHLKAIFDKVGVRSRSELVARVLGEHYFPHIGP